MNTESTTPLPRVAETEQIATQYVIDQLQAARASLRNTQIVAVVLILAIIGYMSWVTIGLRAEFEPKEAAKNAKGIIAIQVNQHAQEFADRIKKVVPGFVAQFPDYVLKQLPVYRAELEAKINADIVDYSKKTSQEMATHLDHFFTEHQDKIKELLHTAQDVQTVRLMGPDLEAEILGYLKEKTSDGESIQQKFDHSLAALERVSTQLNHLATAGDLTPNEKRLRQAIAVLMKKADWDAAKHVN